MITGNTTNSGILIFWNGQLTLPCLGHTAGTVVTLLATLQFNHGLIAADWATNLRPLSIHEFPLKHP